MVKRITLVKEFRGFTPTPIGKKPLGKQLPGGFTLLELIIVVTVVTILALIALPNFSKAKNRAVAKEAISNLKLIAAAERIYKMENNVYTTCTCTTSANCAVAASGCNPLLKLMLNTSNWGYSVAGSAAAVTATATYQSSSGCQYTIASSNFDAEPAKIGGASCP